MLKVVNGAIVTLSSVCFVAGALAFGIICLVPHFLHVPRFPMLEMSVRNISLQSAFWHLNRCSIAASRFDEGVEINARGEALSQVNAAVDARSFASAGGTSVDYYTNRSN